MSLFLPRLARLVANATLLLSLSAALAVPPLQANEVRSGSDGDSVERIAPLFHHDYGGIITELPPLKPYKKDAIAKSPAPAAAPVAQEATAQPPAEQAAPVDAQKSASAEVKEAKDSVDAKAADLVPQARATAAVETDSAAGLPQSAPAPAPAPAESMSSPADAKAAELAPAAKAASQTVTGAEANSPQAASAPAKPIDSAAAEANGSNLARGANATTTAAPSEANALERASTGRSEAPAPVDAKAAEPVPDAAPAAPTEVSSASAATADVTPSTLPANAAVDPQATDMAAPASASPAREPTVSAKVPTAAGRPEEGADAKPAPATTAEQGHVASENSGSASSQEAATSTATAAQPEPQHGPAVLDAARVAAIIVGGVKGPAEVRLADRATYSLPAGRVFLPKDKARELVEAAGHQWDDSTVGVALGESTGSEWLAFVDLLDEGYIKDDDASHLDPTKLLDSYKTGVAAGNEARMRAGAKPLVVTGWVDAPRYDEKHRLVSCVGASQEPAGDPKNRIVNCTSYALGRSGAFRVIVATSGEAYESLKDEASNIAGSIAYDVGKGYADVDLVKDPIAGYGLAALATGVFATKQPTRAGADKVSPPAADGHLVDYALFLVAGLAAIGLVARRLMTKKASPTSAKSPVDADKSLASGSKALALQSFLQSMKARFVRVRKQTDAKSETQTPAPAPNVAAASVASEGEQAPSALAKLAALMRKKAPEPAHVQVKVDRLARRTRASGNVGLQGGAPEPMPAKSEAQQAEAVSELEHELIEPGAADAEALRAREPKRSANG
jgi:uncharacterized membrane-anchored protein